VIFFGNGATVIRIADIDSADASPMEEKVFPHRRSVLRIKSRGTSHRIEFYHNKHAAEAAKIISKNMLRLGQ